MRVDIVLATYNGEKFISELIKSLFQQTHQNWKLIVSDDGSKDKTVEVINQYISLDSRITLVNECHQGGVINNFNRGLSFVESDYIMFADQDDVWLPEKIEKSIEFLRSVEIIEGKDCPLLLFTDLTVVDDKLSVISPSFYQYRNLNPLNNTSAEYLSWCSTLYGCTLLFNRALLQIVKNIDDRVMMHDQIFGLFASLFGKVIFLDESTILYRQHSDNVIGGINKTWQSKLLNVQHYLSVIESYYQKIISQNFFLVERASQDKLTLDFLKISNLLFSAKLSERIDFCKICILPFLWERFPLNLILLCLIVAGSSLKQNLTGLELSSSETSL